MNCGSLERLFFFQFKRFQTPGRNKIKRMVGSARVIGGVQDYFNGILTKTNDCCVCVISVIVF